MKLGVIGTGGNLGKGHCDPGRPAEIGIFGSLT